MSGRELTLLAEGRIELLGRILRSSNETFLVRVSSAEDSACAVYKPEAGERPLHGALLTDLTSLAEAVPADVAGLLDDEEITALQRRVQRLLRDGVLAVDRTGTRYPWPLV